MASSRLFFIFTLLAAIALAAPAQVRRRGLAKRSFKVPRQLNKAHPTGPNGAAAMRKVFRKYNFVVKEDFATHSLASTNTTGTSAGGNKTGTVAANPEQNAALFLSPVDVGGQMLNLDFDSGSSDL